MKEIILTIAVGIAFIIIIVLGCLSPAPEWVFGALILGFIIGKVASIPAKTSKFKSTEELEDWTIKILDRKIK